MPPRVLVTRNSASGMPSSRVISDEAPIISRVSRVPCSRRSSSSDIAKPSHVIGQAACPLEDCRTRLAPVHPDQQVAESAALDAVDAAVY
ncbi:hypothetical protein D3C78_1871900 [compost metagenome]